jgi:hypothetical protein
MISREQWKIDIDGLDMLLGVWLFFMPLLLGVTLPQTTIIVLMAIGLIATADALWAWGKPGMRTPEWVMGVVGVVLFVSPWALQFKTEAAVAWNAWIIGAILAVDAVLAYVARARGK